MDTQVQTKLIQSYENGSPKLPQKINKFRRYFPQVLASCCRNCISLNTGSFDGLKSIVIPSLLGLSNELNPDESVHITPSQASWLASFAAGVHPIGSITGWILSDAIGRKRSLLLATIPPIIGWSLLGISTSIWMINISFMIMGLGLGLKEASSLTYTGEITETSIRGVLLASGAIFSSIGNFALFFFGAFLPWRKVALICVSAPICAFMAIFFVPETPIWLLSKDRREEALKSLRWLRGCVLPETVIDEYENLAKYSARSRICNKCTKQFIECNHTDTFQSKLKELRRKRIIKPLILVILLHFFLQFSAINTWQPYIIQILRAYAIKLNPNYTVVVMSSMVFLARICLLPLLKKFGKRAVYLASTAITFLCCFGLSTIAYMLFPSEWSGSSFQISSNGTNSTNLQESIGNWSYGPLALILIMQFALNVGIANVPYVLIGEVFPFKLRSMLTSIVFACTYVFGAISVKLYYNIELWLTLPGAAAFYGCISLIGFILMYLILPETEGRSLEEIELHFSDNSRRITDIKIEKKARANDNP